MRPYGLQGGSDQQDRVQPPRLLQGSCGGCGNNDDDGADENVSLIVILMYTVKIRKILCDKQVKHIPNTNLISSTLENLALILFLHHCLYKKIDFVSGAESWHILLSGLRCRGRQCEEEVSFCVYDVLRAVLSKVQSSYF